jgi:sugar/nucleoside kinase (ribokinase family)
MDVVTVGDVMIDVRVDSDGLEEGGDVHGRVLVRPGGSAANAAVWAVEAGATSRVHGRIGSDVAGALLRDELIARGVEPALAIDRTAETGTMLVVHEPRERSMVADRGAAGGSRPRTCPNASRRAPSWCPGTRCCSSRPRRPAWPPSSAPARGSSRSTRHRGR